MADPRLQNFIERYEKQDAPWDTGITPPEIVAITAELVPGKALDLGCGTGTNVRYLLEHGWDADGIDFVPQAIEIARSKMAAYPSQRCTLLCHDVTRLDACDDLRAPYDLVVDIGCGHGLSGDAAEKYAQDIADLLKPGGIVMLYTHFPSAERHFGWTDTDVHDLFSGQFEIVSEVLSTDTTNGSPSGWFRLQRKA